MEMLRQFAFVLLFAYSQGLTPWSWSHETHHKDIDDVLRDSFNYGSNKHGQFGIGADDSLSIAKDPSGNGNWVMRVFYKTGTFSSHNSNGGHCDSAHGEKCHRGAQFYSIPSVLEHGTHTTITLEYEVFFDSTFQWQKGGKLPGLWGGSRDCSGGRISDECFSTRLMWRANGDGEVYTYVTHDGQKTDFDSDFCHHAEHYSRYHRIECTGKGIQLGSGAFQFSKNKWIKIRQEVHLNSSPGNNGWVKLWVDDHAEIHVTSIVMRDNTHFDIDGLFFSSFYGGNDDSWECPHDTYTYFRNFRISSETQTPSSSQLVG